MTTDSDLYTDDSCAAEPPILRVRGPADLVQAVPYLLGFHPSRSLVLVGLDRKRVVVTARLDLPDLDVTSAVFPKPDVELSDALAETIGAMWRGGARDFVGAVFDADAVPSPGLRTGIEPLPWAGLAAVLLCAVADVGATVDDVVLVSSNRLWSYVCTVSECCPPEGTELELSSTVAAAATYAGLVALPDRGSLQQLIEPLPDHDREPLRPLLDAGEVDAVGAIVRGSVDRENRSVKRALFAAGRASDLPGAEPNLPDEQVVRFGVALRRYEVRDSLWMAVDDGRIDGRVLWRYLARRLPAPFDAPPLFLFAWCTYRKGDGALASIAADRALDSDPTYSAADLLVAALSQAIDPRRLPKLRSRSSA